MLPLLRLPLALMDRVAKMQKLAYQGARDGHDDGSRGLVRWGPPDFHAAMDHVEKSKAMYAAMPALHLDIWQ